MNRWIAGLAAIALAAAASAGALAQTPPQDPDVEAGRQIFAQNCAACHGANATGAQAPSAVGPMWRHGSSPAEIAATITHGYPGLGMPAWDGRLTPTQIRQVVAFIENHPMVQTAKAGGLRALVLAQSAALPPADPLPVGVVRTDAQAYRIEKFAHLDAQPYGMAFLPDGRILVTETTGALRVIDHGRLLPSPIAGTPHGATPQDVNRRSLLDVAVHPDYAANGWVYLTWAEQAPDTVGSGGIRFSLTRGRIRDGRWADSQALFTAPATSSLSGRIALDGKGHVFVTTAERVAPEGSALEQAGAQDLRDPGGKVLRLNDDGSVPADNPFVGRQGVFPAVWTYGHRSPLGLAFDREGRLWETEDGPRGGDELNLIEPSRNYGWPVITWGHSYDDAKPLPDHPEREGMEQPKLTWNPAPAISAVAVYKGDAFPAWKDNLFITSLKYRSLFRVVMNGTRPVLQETVLYNIDRLRDVAVGPDGFIYLLCEDGDILRMRPAT